ncbi:unnamed protein product, partial [Rotaria sordida]
MSIRGGMVVTNAPSLNNTGSPSRVNFLTI